MSASHDAPALLAKHKVQIGYKSACNTYVHTFNMIASKSVESVWQSCRE